MRQTNLILLFLVFILAISCKEQAQDINNVQDKEMIAKAYQTIKEYHKGEKLNHKVVRLSTFMVATNLHCLCGKKDYPEH